MRHNMIYPLRSNAPDVVQDRWWWWNHESFTGRGRPSDTIVGPTTKWVRVAMERAQNFAIPFFILYGLQEEQKFVCAVHHVLGQTLYVTCLKTSVSFYAMFDHIWELLHPIHLHNPVAQQAADLRARRTAAISAARTLEIQQRAAPTSGHRRRPRARPSSSNEVRLFRYES
ncbi:hypothetical protein FRACYDRAFT_239421 [Fragilariopsis cylindrus CCMP1102]|uniref:Uncharacterized protein n=1 Tax=Fragilariopsis cylindrus CCMP1102 TaxID=635003 RepID=A0A1E7FFC2_9STRA|nr:hypothetical protein FRACYDRAFT_239421 [Fragilariopsis cylindrus CCMP1102]|eukprot:OEU16826.1 hypothetical protein FRACYDRAFT_239421 [Fragilariopsis cylindrus CCMP1102]